MKSLFMKTFLSVILSTLSIIAIISIILVLNSRNAIKNEAQERLIALSEAQSVKIERRLENIEEIMKSLGDTFKDYLGISQAMENDTENFITMLEPVYRDYLNLTNYLKSITLIGLKEACFKGYRRKYFLNNGNMQWENISENDANKMINDNINVLNSKDIYWTEPELIGEKWYISIYSELECDNGFAALIRLEIDYSQVREAISALKIYNSGYAVLLNEKFDFLYHPTFTPEENLRTVVNGDIAHLADEMERKEKGYIEYVFLGQDKILGFAKLSNSWTYLIAPPIDEIYAPVNRLILNVIIISIISVALITVVSLVLSRMISKPVKNISQKVKEFGNGNLTVEFDQSGKDEIGQMSLEIKNTTEKIRDSITAISNISQELDKNAVETEKLSFDNFKEIEKIFNRIEDMSENLQSVSSTFEEISSGIEESADIAKNNTDSVTELKVNIEKTYRDASEGMKDIENATGLFQNLKNYTDEVARLINDLSDKSNNVGEIVQSIQNIAEQTNLLALNAAIEAARAGEAGKGFAVVADEIRKLSEESKKSTLNITNVLKEIQDLSVETRKKSDNSVSFVKDINRETMNAFEHFSEIISEIGDITKLSENLSNAIKEHSEITSDMSGSILNSSDNLMSVSEKSREVVDSTYKQKEYSDSFRESAAFMRGLADKLMADVEKYTIKQNSEK